MNMAGTIKVDAGNIDKKYFYAFIKGLSTIKYKEYLQKSKSSGQGGAADADENVDLSYLYGNLFNEQETSLECSYIPNFILNS